MNDFERFQPQVYISLLWFLHCVLWAVFTAVGRTDPFWGMAITVGSGAAAIYMAHFRRLLNETSVR